jgi:RNA polymerase sigma-70 factor (ECF subfamily)
MIHECKQRAGTPDTLWLIGVQAKDRLAFESLYNCYREPLSRFLRRFTDRQDIIEEVINDSFMVIWLHAGKFRAESQVSTWIFGIAYRTAMKALRRRPNLCYLSEMMDMDEPAIDPTADFESKDWLDRAIGTLSRDQRATLLLAYKYGYSVEEISNLMASPQGTVKARMFHGRSNLRAKGVAWHDLSDRA